MAVVMLTEQVQPGELQPAVVVRVVRVEVFHYPELSQVAQEV
jgi:hypothetical protein